MSRDSIKYFFSILFLFAVACSGAIQACPGRSAQPVNNEANTYQEKQVPNAELERVHPPVVPGGQIAAQKNLVFSDLLSMAAFHEPAIAAESSFIKSSSLLVKDQLLHNYPSHNFW